MKRLSAMFLSIFLLLGVGLLSTGCDKNLPQTSSSESETEVESNSSSESEAELDDEQTLLIETYEEKNPLAGKAFVVNYYGKYESGAIVAMMAGSDMGFADVIMTDVVAGYAFNYPDSNTISVLYGGDFYSLASAYTNGYLTENDIVDIATKHREFYPYLYNELDYFSFSMTWGIYGISSYDSLSGRLVKTKDAPNPDDYVTNYILTERELSQIYEIIQELDVLSYPDVYNPTEGIGTDPCEYLILSVRTNTFNKTITAMDVALDDATSEKGQKYMDACQAISDILEGTDEWKALPDYPFLYD